MQNKINPFNFALFKIVLLRYGKALITARRQSYHHLILDNYLGILCTVNEIKICKILDKISNSIRITFYVQIIF